MFTQKIGEVIAMAAEDDPVLLEKLLCRECLFRWRSPSPAALRRRLIASGERRLASIAPWVGVPRLVLNDKRRIISANPDAMEAIYGYSAKKIFEHYFTLAPVDDLDPDLVERLIPLFHGRRFHLLDQDRHGNLIVLRCVGRMVRGGLYQSLRTIVDVIPAGKMTPQEAIHEKGVYPPLDRLSPCGVCGSGVFCRGRRVCPPGVALRQPARCCPARCGEADQALSSMRPGESD